MTETTDRGAARARLDDPALRQLLAGLTAVRGGDFGTRLPPIGDDLLDEIVTVFNGMIDQLALFTSEVTRVAREVGTEGKLGGQAEVPGVSGSWKDLTDNVNAMAGNLTGQVRSIAQVATAVAKGDLSQKITVDARGEILELKSTINTMVDQLSGFADEVTRVAREVGTDGILGGQAEVEGLAGTWKRLAENVNELAGNLTRQVRAIAAVTSAVATGDLTRSIDVDAQGEAAELKDNINAMVRSLRETTRANQEQDWLKTSLAHIAGLMQGHRDLETVAQLVIDELTPMVDAQYGTFLLAESGVARLALNLIASYGYQAPPGARRFDFGQSLVGQAARTKRPITVAHTPAGYLTIASSLGQSAPVALIVLPILFEDQVLGVIELASFNPFAQAHHDFLNLLTETIGVNVNTIIASARTDALLEESQRLASELQARSEELQSRQEDLQLSNAELEEKATLLARQNHDIEVKNFEIEQARQELEERARQLALASKYKSEFLANMSHELRTPLNSLLILARLLAQNPTRNLSPKQVEYAHVIHSAGSDLLQLILDLSKVEAGKMDIHLEEVALGDIVDDVQATFSSITAEKGLRFTVATAPDLPPRLRTDRHLVAQVLRNLLSNAVKFTEQGSVELAITSSGASAGAGGQVQGQAVLFSVSDTGIGIAGENLERIFGAFQQGDGTTSRRYGGTGLGLSICREVATLLGGEIQARSEFGRGSTFTLRLPMVPPATTSADAYPQLSAGRPPSNAVPPAQRAALSAATTVTLDLLPPALAALAPPVNATAPARPAAEPAEPSHPPTTTPGLAGRTVLVVDDDVRNVFAITSILNLHGLRVIHAGDGRMGIDALVSNPGIDLVLMDVMMPEMDGYATTAAIRTMPQFADLPIIAVTAKAMPDDRQKCLDAGATDYVAKPVDIEELLACIRASLTPGRRSRWAAPGG
ncbi:ATP-binding protein [Candidatus Frankia alpina]|uniref:hybrid sensor histidine kinase/response regulator n=1 Tax=Candidatus Frankia alpina TaxID=2699483 RepID=UPI0013D233AB|nr:ATP-binding protein [Candidatus Frankia alpina]